MYTKEEFAALKLEFWNALNEELKLIKNPHGSKVNWLNYNTRIKNLYFRMEADEFAVRLCIDMQFRNDGVREVIWEQFLEFKDNLESIFNNQLIWNKEFSHSNGLVIARIAIEKDRCSMYNKKDWPAIFEFFKENYSKLDAFWFEFNDLFKSLMN